MLISLYGKCSFHNKTITLFYGSNLTSDKRINGKRRQRSETQGITRVRIRSTVYFLFASKTSSEHLVDGEQKVHVLLAMFLALLSQRLVF